MLSNAKDKEPIEIWLRWYRGLVNKVPAKFVSDMDYAQINAVKAVYQESAVQLCIVHIGRNLFRNSAGMEKEARGRMLRVFQALYRSTTEDAFEEGWVQLIEQVRQYPKFQKYLRMYYKLETRSKSSIMCIMCIRDVGECIPTSRTLERDLQQ
jgi:transposase-like protein